MFIAPKFTEKRKNVKKKLDITTKKVYFREDIVVLFLCSYNTKVYMKKKYCQEKT